MIYFESLWPFEVTEIKCENFILRYTFQFLVKKFTSILRQIAITLSNVVM
jgi:hypothetical protein